MKGKTILHFLAEAMGFNKKQLRRVFPLVGYSFPQGARRAGGQTEITETDRLAMTAAYFGLPPFSEELHAALDDDAREAMMVARLKIEVRLGANAGMGRSHSEIPNN